MSVQALNRKEAIASGEDIAPVTREEYYLKGLAEGQGGGGLEYVIPEQTTTVVYDERSYVAYLENVNASGLDDEQALFAEVQFPNIERTAFAAAFESNTITIPVAGLTIRHEGGDSGRWFIEAEESALGASITIAVIKGF